MAADAERLLDAAFAGDRGALARLLTMVERGGTAAHDVGRIAFDRAGAADTVGITGSPGAGKSTLTSALVAHVRSLDLRPAVLAIDPSSPFSGGALLGDRVRMSEHALDDGVYIRSMATRGHLGGLALSTPEAIRVLDAAGFTLVIVETVGVGQVEVEVAGAADTTVVVVNPGWGDAVQANKAGLMEIADVFVVNKADRPGAEQTMHELESMMDLTDTGPWRPPVVRAVASVGEGADELWEAVTAHRRHLEDSGELARRRSARTVAELELIVDQRLRARAEALLGASAHDELRRSVADGTLDPWTAADQLLVNLDGR